MKKVISARDVEDLLRRGGDLNSIPADALLTPSARDFGEANDVLVMARRS